MELTAFTPSSAILTVVALAFLPFLAVMVTSFTKMVVVLSLLRNALGLQQVPPNMVINGIAMILTIYVMYPVFQTAQQELLKSDIELTNTENLLQAAEIVKEPLRDFLIKHSNPDERIFFLKTISAIASKNHPDLEANYTMNDFIVVIPAFTIGEITEAFQIGFLIFLPFLILDLVISNILLALNMMMLSPTIISLPFKILLLVMAEGWVKLSHSLVTSYL